MKGTIITITAILTIVLILFYITKSPEEINSLLKAGILPRIVAWFCLIYGAYGLARTRIPFSIAMMFFAAAFFFAYIGPYVPFIKNYY